jgi:hypothetical protein
MAAYPLSDIRPASVMQIRPTISVVPRCTPMGSITTIASLASPRLESISTEKPRAKLRGTARSDRAVHGQAFRGLGVARDRNETPRTWKASYVGYDACNHPPVLSAIDDRMQN